MTRTRRNVVGHELVHGGHGPEWALRADLDDGSSIYYPLPGGFDIPGVELQACMGELLAPISSRHPLWIHRHRHRLTKKPFETSLPEAKSLELSRKVGAALAAVEAALTVERVHMEIDT